AFALIGIHEYLRRYAGDRRASQVREELAGRLLALYQRNRSDEWRWYEEVLTYCNAALPHALLMCGQAMPNKAMTEVGLESLRWLAALQRLGVILSPSDPTAFIGGAVSVPGSINSRWRLKPWYPPASQQPRSRETSAGARKPDVPSSGSSGVMN